MLGLWTLAQVGKALLVLKALNSCAHGTETLHTLQAGVMFANGLAVLNNERFLEKSDALVLRTCLLFAIINKKSTGHNVCVRCSWLGLFTTTWRQRHWPRPWGFQTADNWAATCHDLYATYALAYALGYICVCFSTHSVTAEPNNLVLWVQCR